VEKSGVLGEYGSPGGITGTSCNGELPKENDTGGLGSTLKKKQGISFTKEREGEGIKFSLILHGSWGYEPKNKERRLFEKG